MRDNIPRFTKITYQPETFNLRKVEAKIGSQGTTESKIMLLVSVDKSFTNIFDKVKVQISYALQPLLERQTRLTALLTKLLTPAHLEDFKEYGITNLRLHNSLSGANMLGYPLASML